MKARGVVSWTAVVVTSVGLHAAVFASLGGPGTTVAAVTKPPSFMELAPLPPPRVAEAAPAAEPAKSRKPAFPRARAKRTAPPATTPPPETAPAAEAEALADFTGMTLTSAGPGAGWSSAIGAGERMSSPVGRPGARVTGQNVGGGLGADAGPPVVGVGDLSRLPEAPALDDALERNYPPTARRAGRNGQALVRARVMPDGRVRELKVASESLPGFGAACIATLAQSRWTAPLDRDGHAVSTYIQYTCRFEVR